MPRNKRRRPEIDMFFALQEPTPNPQAPPEVIHRHTAFEVNTSGLTRNRISHNHVYVTVPGVAPPPEPAPDTLIHNMDTSNYAMDTEGTPDLRDVEEDEEDEDDDEYPYNWMDPSFVQGRATTSKDTTDKQPKRKARLATVCSSSPYLLWLIPNDEVGYSVASLRPPNRPILTGDHPPRSTLPSRHAVYCM